MIILEADQTIFIYDSDHLCWLEREDYLRNAEYTLESVAGGKVGFYDRSEEYTVTQTELEALYLFTQQLLQNPEGVIAWEDAPCEGQYGALHMQFDYDPDNAYRTLFYFSANDGKLFLMSLSNDFGYSYGEYIYTAYTKP